MRGNESDAMGRTDLNVLVGSNAGHRTSGAFHHRGTNFHAGREPDTASTRNSRCIGRRSIPEIHPVHFGVGATRVGRWTGGFTGPLLPIAGTAGRRGIVANLSTEG